MGFPFLFALCSCASIVIWFVDIEKGRDNCRAYVEERKLLRVAKGSGLTTHEVIRGIATGEMGGSGSGSELSDNVEAIDFQGTRHLD
jgi:hypothetical protein